MKYKMHHLVGLSYKDIVEGYYRSKDKDGYIEALNKFVALPCFYSCHRFYQKTRNVKVDILDFVEMLGKTQESVMLFLAFYEKEAFENMPKGSILVSEL